MKKFTPRHNFANTTEKAPKMQELTKKRQKCRILKKLKAATLTLHVIN